MIGKIVKEGAKKVMLATPVIGLTVVSAVITKYILDDLKERSEKKKDSEETDLFDDDSDIDWDDDEE
jgi:hypothetical protein